MGMDYDSNSNFETKISYCEALIRALVNYYGYCLNPLTTVNSEQRCVGLV